MSSAESSVGENEDRSKKTFVCSSLGCNQRFSTAERLAIHKQKHQMTLMLGPSKGNLLQDVLPVDQTPTPTRFLHLGNQVGLFDELKENPFDREFKSAQKEGGITPKQRRAASVVQQLQLRTNNHKSNTPTTPTWPATFVSSAATEANHQPVHVITLTPTLPSPGMLSASGQYFIPPLLPSPSIPGYPATSPMQVPATLLSPTLVPFGAGFLQSPMMADHQRAFAQVMFAAAASAASSPLANAVVTAPDQLNKSSQDMSSFRPNPAHTNSQELQQHQQHHQHQHQPSISVPTLILPKQERPQSVSASYSEPASQSAVVSHPTVITQVPSQNHTSYNNTVSQPMSYPMLSQNMSETRTMGSIKGSMVAMAAGSHSTMPTMATLPSVSSLSMSQHHNTLEQQQSLSRTSSNEFGSTSNLAEAKQKLKETLTNNNPNLQHVIAAETERRLSSSSESSAMQMTGEEQKPTPRRRGRQQQDIDPDVKRQRFLERNRAAASRCRNKKKKWVNGLESKAKGLSSFNMQLQNEIASLKDEIASLKQLLLSHRDCPITKMQQQSMAMAGINLNTLEPSTPSTLNNMDIVVKSESPGSSAGEGPHPSLTGTYSTGSVDDNMRGSNPNLAMPSSAAQQEQLTNGRSAFPNISTSATT